MVSIEKSFEELTVYYNDVLNKDKTTYVSSNDEPTPIECITEMINKIPDDLWNTPDLKILDPCCGNGNFMINLFFKLKEKGLTNKKILNDIFHFNDINKSRLDNVKVVFDNSNYDLNITNQDFLEFPETNKYHLIVANPPYAKISPDGKRASKNHNLIKLFLDKAINLLRPDGYLLFITPDNWMSYSDRNLLISKITKLQIIHLDIHTAKKYFKKIGSSFTWYVIQNKPAYKDISVRSLWKNKIYDSIIPNMEKKYIPLLYTKEVQSILSKTIENEKYQKYNIQTSSDLHKYTKRDIIQTEQTADYPFKLIHTPKQTVYSNRPHKFQGGYKVFIPTTDKYIPFVENDCGMTQSIAFIRCEDNSQAEYYKSLLSHDLYKFINNITRWGNFNNIRILQSFTMPSKYTQPEGLYDFFEITKEEQKFIEENL